MIEMRNQIRLRVSDCNQVWTADSDSFTHEFSLNKCCLTTDVLQTSTEVYLSVSHHLDASTLCWLFWKSSANDCLEWVGCGGVNFHSFNFCQYAHFKCLIHLIIKKHSPRLLKQMRAAANSQFQSSCVWFLQRKPTLVWPNVVTRPLEQLGSSQELGS